MKKTKFKFGDKVYDPWVGNGIFYCYGIFDKSFPQFNVNIFIPGQNESCGVNSEALKKGWKKKLK